MINAIVRTLAVVVNDSDHIRVIVIINSHITWIRSSPISIDHTCYLLSHFVEVIACGLHCKELNLFIGSF